MRLVCYLVGKEKSPRVGVARDDSDGAAILDLAAASRKLGKAAPPKGAGVKEIIALAAGPLGRLSKALKALWSAIDADPKLGRSLLADRSRIRFLPPIPNPEKIICIGQNYIDHCREQNAPIPQSPIIFAKFPPALIGHGGSVRLPRISQKVDYEAELAFVIGKVGRHIPVESALDHVAGYMPLNDVSARDLQFSDGQWVRGKSCETFAPCGPALVTRDDVPDPHALRIGLTLNGRSMQDSNTSNLIFKIPFLVHFLSQVFTLKPGDIVTTGTPPGVGCFRKPPVFLREGDTMTVWIDGLGRLTNKVVLD